ncbi:MAG: hypothetical protein IJZ65_09720 [Ruminiclostridium sp.]|nr:hypothetical protein [Ruminiclostridium sp.]
MSSRTIKVILRVAGVISGIGGMIIGGEIAENVLGMESFLVFVVAIVTGFLFLVSYFAIGNVVADMERTADAVVYIYKELKKINQGTEASSVSKGTFSTINKLSSIANGEQYVSDSWNCKKCGRLNQKTDMICKDCGEYK